MQPKPQQQVTDIGLSGYYRRVGVVAGLLVVLIALALAFAPQVQDVAIVEQTPARGDVPIDSPVSITFSRPVNRRSLEQAFVIYPVVKGRLTWRDAQTVLFQPLENMQPNTIYHITIRPGLRDVRGRVNQYEMVISFLTRPSAD